MPFFDPIRIGAAGAVDTAFTVDRSAKFRGATDQRFDRTLSSTSSSYTVSMWFKVRPVTTNFSRGLFTLGPANNTEVAGVVFTTADKLIFHGGNGTSSITNARVFRDTSAWYHFTYSVNSNNFTAYINGESLQTGTVRSLDTTSNGFRLGGWWGGYDLFRGYIADFYLIDGLALTPSSFTETNVETGQLVPKLYTGSFGTSGAHLLFNDNSGTTATTLGKDSSGNGNNFTPINFATRDSVPDTPTNNFCTFNPLKAYTNGATFDEGNLRCTHGASGNGGAPVNFGLQSGKWYAEMLIEYDGNGTQVGISGEDSAINSFPITDCLMIGASGEVITNGSNSYPSLPVGNTFTAGDIMGMALDITGGTIKWYKNNSLVYTLNLSTMTSGGNSDSVYFFTSGDGSSSTAGRHVLNAGQDSTFCGNKTKQGNADGNGIGDFYYSPPSGHLAVCSANLPDPTIKLPNKHFDTLLYTGNGSDNRDLTGLNFAPDWLWIKRRDGSMSNNLGDTVRGADKILFSDQTASENTETDRIKAYNSDGFRLGTDSAVNFNGYTYVAWNWDAGETDGKTYAVTVVSDSGNKYRFDGFGTSAVTLDLAEGGTYVFDWSDSSAQGHPIRFSTTSDGTHGGGSEYTTGVTKDDSAYKTTITVAASAPQLFYYCQNHSGMGGAINTNSTLGSSNFDGSIQTTVKVSASAGMSIIRYTGTGADATIGHGLGVAPNVAFTKKRSGSQNWLVKHSAAGSGKVGYLDITDPFDSTGSGGGIISDFSSSSNYSITRYNNSGNYGNVNESSATYVSYVFSEVAGYSRFGSYTGNGSSNGTFVFTGFRPALVIFKNSTSTEAWSMFDNKRDPDNPVEKFLRPSANNGDTSGSNDIDFLSNGFKARTSNNPNSSGATYIYLAFAESPFKNARAR